MKISYEWLKSYIPDIPSKDELASFITFHVCEIDGIEKVDEDTVFDLKVLPDRAHDLLSHFGVAREISGLLGLKIFPNSYLEKNNRLNEKIDTNLEIDIETNACRRYMGRVVRNIKVGPSPKWLIERLNSMGQRSINNIVDITNFVMFDLGQPIHAFDFAKIEGSKIIVKQAHSGDSLDLVGSEKLVAKLSTEDMMIGDQGKNLAIAGVKGGLSSSVSDQTTDLVIEVANFDPVSVRKTARRLGIQTDASKRYENNLSPEFCEMAMNEVSNLIQEICGDAVFEKVVDVYKKKEEERTIIFTRDYISKLLGVQVEDVEIEKILNNYNYQFAHNPGFYEVKVPFYRLDLFSPHDMVEEIGRVYGYDKIPSKLDNLPSGKEDNIVWNKICLAKEKLIIDGYKEVMTYAFTDKGDVEIMASASDKNYLRNNLTDGLKESIKLNQNNLPLLLTDQIKIFEIGTVFIKDREEIHVAYGDKKNINEKTLDKFIEENFGGDIGIAVLERTKIENIFYPWSPYPFITRDIAVWVPEGTSPENLIKIYKEFGTELLVTEPFLFDSFTKDGKTSLAFRLVFQAVDRTLTDEEINNIMSNITKEVLACGFTVR